RRLAHRRPFLLALLHPPLAAHQAPAGAAVDRRRLDAAPSRRRSLLGRHAGPGPRRRAPLDRLSRLPRHRRRRRRVHRLQHARPTRRPRRGSISRSFAQVSAAMTSREPSSEHAVPPPFGQEPENFRGGKVAAVGIATLIVFFFGCLWAVRIWATGAKEINPRGPSL